MSRWVARTERTVSEKIPAAPEEVREFYVDLHNIKKVHPLVVEVHTTGREQTADGYQLSYQVKDRVPLGPLQLRIKYGARLHVPDSGPVTAEARQFPRVRLRTTVTFEPIDDGTLITEHMRIEAPRLLAAMTVNEAVKAHTAMLAGMRECFG
ncbi:SRPBCC family protein [Mycobacterium sp. 3519A]|uniref:SRPBCC family protein n=1 Tax=Mycobacterium sp. 3519A TaxID=2057184 RepID=UPI000C798F43|nr:SRPBCC family protein [Mycobacterium sp. 3519A]